MSDVVIMIIGPLDFSKAGTLDVSNSYTIGALSSRLQAGIAYSKKQVMLACNRDLLSIHGLHDATDDLDSIL